MKIFLLIFCWLMAFGAKATPLYVESCESYSLGLTITTQPLPNWRTDYGSGGNCTVTAHFGGQAFGISVTAGNWGSCLYNGLTASGAISYTARVDQSGTQRTNLCIFCTTSVAGVFTDGYQTQFIAGTLYFQRGGYAVTISSVAATVADSSNFVVGVWNNGNGCWHVFLDGVEKIVTGIDTTHTSGQIGFGEFSSLLGEIDAFYVDDLTPTPGPSKPDPSKTNTKTMAYIEVWPTPVRLGRLP